MIKRPVKAIVTASALMTASAFAIVAHAAPFSTFPLTRPAAVPAECAPHAGGEVSVKPGKEGETLQVKLFGMPKNSDVELFAIQVPEFPFGMSWYIGDVKTDRRGRGFASFKGRFNEETFVVAPDTAPAPLVHHESITDATFNPPTAPIHTYHIGVWFSSPEDAAAAGCPDIVTPFNGEHNAGIQVLNTGLFPDEAGPLLDPTLPE